MISHRFHDDEIRARFTVQIDTINSTLKVVGIHHGDAEDCRSTYDFRSAIWLFMNEDVDVNFWGAVFHRFAELIAEDRGKNATDTYIIRKAMKRKAKKNKHSSKKQNENKKV